MYHKNLDIENLRKKAITLLMAGSFINFGDMNGNSSSGFSGCLNPDSAHIEAHTTLRTVWNIFDAIPCHQLTPKPDLADGALCLSNGSEKHLIYAPDGEPFSVNFNVPVQGNWINPRNGEEKAIRLTERYITPPETGDWLLWIDDKPGTN